MHRWCCACCWNHVNTHRWCCACCWNHVNTHPRIRVYNFIDAKSCLFLFSCVCCGKAANRVYNVSIFLLLGILSSSMRVMRENCQSCLFRVYFIVSIIFLPRVYFVSISCLFSRWLLCGPQHLHLGSNHLFE